jgi:hypothetical protein
MQVLHDLVEPHRVNESSTVQYFVLLVFFQNESIGIPSMLAAALL